MAETEQRILGVPRRDVLKMPRYEPSDREFGARYYIETQSEALFAHNGRGGIWFDVTTVEVIVRQDGAIEAHPVHVLLTPEQVGAIALGHRTPPDGVVDQLARSGTLFQRSP